ncbi:hypothetical protein M9H77_06191 [Catharanthus roseus]|uniref:Uncharacterized protein n=1 Tax=Catharanthus roseus TaxID=4058 RepID=A0ACC0BRC7_CATRO|nr:hypothetical protein M9H77_06191 [Catharanthus roseus]
MDIPENLEALNKWTIPRVDLKTVYQLGTFEKLGLKQWKLERTGYTQSKTEHNIDHIEQTPEGIVYIQMDSTPSRLGAIPRTYSTRSERSYISPLLEDKDYIPYRVSTSQVSERDEHYHHVNKVLKTKENIVKGVYNTQDPDITESEMNFSL